MPLWVIKFKVPAVGVVLKGRPIDEDWVRYLLTSRDNLIGYFWVVQMIGLAANSVRGAVVYAQRLQATTHIDAERAPRKRWLKHALAQIARKEQALCFIAPRCGQEALLSHADIPCLIYDRKIKERALAFAQRLCRPAENHRFRTLVAFS